MLRTISEGTEGIDRSGAEAEDIGNEFISVFRAGFGATTWRGSWGNRVFGAGDALSGRGLSRVG